jgi:hypothetical protein
LTIDHPPNLVRFGKVMTDAAALPFYASGVAARGEVILACYSHRASDPPARYPTIMVTELLKIV